MVINVGINGFGRIGRTFLRATLERKTEIQVVAINDPNIDPYQMAYLLLNDTVHGEFKGAVSADDSNIIVNGRKIQVFDEEMVENIPWRSANVEYVVESSGLFTTQEEAQKHMTAGARRVVISASSKDAPTFVMGANEERYEPSINVFSASSSTNVALSPLLKILEEYIGLEEATVTSIHASTSHQSVVDGPIKRARTQNYRRGRSFFNIIPSKIAIGSSVGHVIPKLRGKVTGIEYRVPLLDAASLDISLKFSKKVTVNDVKAVLEEAQNDKRWNKILGLTNENVVSSDIIGESFSLIADLQLISQNEKGNLIRIVVWHDNEYGYSCRLMDLIEYTYGRSDESKSCTIV